MRIKKGGFTSKLYSCVPLENQSRELNHSRENPSRTETHNPQPLDSYSRALPLCNKRYEKPEPFNLHELHYHSPNATRVIFILTNYLDK